VGEFSRPRRLFCFPEIPFALSIILLCPLTTGTNNPGPAGLSRSLPALVIARNDNPTNKGNAWKMLGLHSKPGGKCRVTSIAVLLPPARPPSAPLAPFLRPWLHTDKGRLVCVYSSRSSLRCYPHCLARAAPIVGVAINYCTYGVAQLPHLQLVLYVSLLQPGSQICHWLPLELLVSGRSYVIHTASSAANADSLLQPNVKPWQKQSVSLYITCYYSDQIYASPANLRFKSKYSILIVKSLIKAPSNNNNNNNNNDDDVHW
jgi:hypothetical protein